MNSHERAQELISARMDASLTPAEHRELQRHLATCDSCRDFVAQADDLARGLQVLPRLAPSPAVSRTVMAAVRADTSGWGWLRRGLQTLSSPGMAVASGLALVVALAGALIITLNAPSRSGVQGIEPESTIAAVAIAPFAEEPTLAMVEEPVDSGASAELAQAAEPLPSGEEVREADAAPAIDDGGTIQEDRNESAEEPVAEPVVEPTVEPAATEAIPDEAIAALESAGT